MFSELTNSNLETNEKHHNIFIVGCYRSGTTLLEKLLHQHDQICIASQPFPDLFFYCKALYFSSVGLSRRYPLEHLFKEDQYTSTDFMTFLNQLILTHDHLEQIGDALNRDKLGLWTPEILDVFHRVSPGPFFDTYVKLIDLCAEIFNKQMSLYKGSKEVLCEEYVPFLLQKGVKTVLVIRDPRDMITSLNFKKRSNLTGENRPILYSLRVWRKSVAIALANESNPDFVWIRYEDLAAHPINVLNRISDFLAISDFTPGMFKNGILHQNGSLWKGNSSFADQNGVGTESINRFSKLLPGDVLDYINACCWPEMKFLGYDYLASDTFNEAAIRTFVGPFTKQHPQFPQAYSDAPDHVEEEIERVHKLEQPLDSKAASHWYLFEAAYKKLARVI
jgi:Sulfotransferase domain